MHDPDRLAAAGPLAGRVVAGVPGAAVAPAAVAVPARCRGRSGAPVRVRMVRAAPGTTVNDVRAPGVRAQVRRVAAHQPWLRIGATWSINSPTVPVTVSPSRGSDSCASTNCAPLGARAPTAPA